MGIAKGTSLGPYEVIAHIGSGGMGDVWRARDRRIGRDVAIKVLPEFAAGDERLKRFEQEARAAGALNHPGLVTIFDVGNVDGAPYIVMELLEGETLRATLDAAKPATIPIRKAIDYAMQIASALAVAHGKGIIHRDLKPENVFVTHDRRVKILDFGLAKLAPDASDINDKNQTSRHLTSAGLVVGTPGYMSPEQVRAAPIDHRTDLFSLGSVLYEMITGQPAFERSSAVETMHAVLMDEPEPLESLAPALSPSCAATITHCLEKNPNERFQSAHDLAFQLRTLPDMAKSVVTRSLTVKAKKWYATPRAAIFALAGLLAASGVGFVLLGMRHPAPPQTVRTFRQLTSADGLELFPTLAPDGRTFAYVSAESGNRDIYVQRVDGHEPTDITADYADDDSEPAFSPDGAQIAFRSERDGGGIFVMGATGESPKRLTNFGHNPAWSPDGTQIVFATEPVETQPENRARTSELWLADVRTGATRPLVQPQKGGADFGWRSDGVQPNWSPNGKRIAFWGLSSLSGQRDLWTIDPHAAEPKKSVVRVTSDAALQWNPVWSPDGKYLYYGSDADGTMNLWRVAMDENSGAPIAPPESMPLPAHAAGHFTFARSGEMAFAAVSGSDRVLAMPFDANTGTLGAPRKLVGGSQRIRNFDPSPDGKIIALASRLGKQEDLFIADTEGKRIRQLTDDAAKDRDVRWSPDGKTLYFMSNRDSEAWWIWRIDADGSGLTRVSDETEAKRLGFQNLLTPVPSPDGRTLLVQSITTSALLHLDRPAGQRLEPLSVLLSSPRWSPDGQFIAAETGADMSVILYTLRTHRVEKLTDNGASPQWTADGRKIVYFGRQDIHILDLRSRAVTTVPFRQIPGEEIDLRATWAVRLSGDGRTLYVQSTSRQSDIWIAQFSRH
ncbi:MAG TPA: protein kinase [Thermoanaerobaculia bacterium]|nr:protein kinase [Thermoanaerobaculia bacterium]